MPSYYRHDIGDNLTLRLRLFDPATQDPVTGADPTVTIRRHRASQGGALLDGWYWNGTTFQATEVLLPMYPNSPGGYLYEFEQTLIGEPTVYLVRFVSTTSPAEGFDEEEHIFSRSDVIVIEAEPSQ